MKKIQLIRKRLEAALKPKQLEIYDESAKHFGHHGERARPETHFFIEIVSEEFVDLPRLDRHRLINEAVNDLFRGGLHALEINARAPGEM